MFNDLIDGIAIKLFDTFGSQYKIYKENIPQELSEPCFVIKLVQPMQTAKLPNRYLRQHLFDILYFPKSTIKSNEEMLEVADKMFIEMEYITVLDNSTRGCKMHCEIVDNVLHFFVNYDFFVKKEAVEVESMKELTVNSKTEA